ncbi:hypothetical protein OOT46_00015 [Aquabacterium sp. A7-Y]|uniref:hypothetical protein n=1 Tax=Aquabacterium sp. A7-Y TaxID=1349605 RepID=UPI00223CB68A|nr:hypothetical protein [Aquabacterium sp. A7-Y]MCW7536239.1 hypothetical protein [Aquabacterium sp. A7-Y]
MTYETPPSPEPAHVILRRIYEDIVRYAPETAFAWQGVANGSDLGRLLFAASAVRAMLIVIHSTFDLVGVPRVTSLRFWRVNIPISLILLAAVALLWAGSAMLMGAAFEAVQTMASLVYPTMQSSELQGDRVLAAHYWLRR